MSTSIKASVLSALRPLARSLTAGSARIFMYHRFGIPGSYRRLAVDVFERQIRYLKAHYQIVPLRDLVEMLLQGKPLSERYVAITVDDGYADFAEYAYPVLKKHQVPATVYLVSGFVDQRLWLWFDAIHYIADMAAAQEHEIKLLDKTIKVNLKDPIARHMLWEAAADIGVGLSSEVRNRFIESFAQQLSVELPMLPTSEYQAMSWEAIRSMDPLLIEWGGHTFSHPILSRCSPEEQFIEIEQGRGRIEEMIQRPVRSFCYPNGQPGDYDEHTIAAIQRAGFTHAVVAHGGMVKPGCHPYLIERLGAPDDEANFHKCVDGIWEVRRKTEAGMSRVFGWSTPHRAAEPAGGHRY